MRLLAIVLSVLLLLPVTVAAQDDEGGGGFIANLLQDSLSGDNRAVRVIGLSGALSSSATIERIVVSDDEGPWLTINGAVLDWTRSALLRGRLDVSTLRADSIEVARLPGTTTTDTELPKAEATPFKVPELPVSVTIGALEVDRLVLGEDVAGKAAELAIAGALSLVDGTLDTNIGITRIDRPNDQINLIANISNTTGQINLDLDVREDVGGLVAELLNIPERPSVRLSIKGEGPVTDFTANLLLATDDMDRVTGQVRLEGAGAVVDGQASEIAFSSDIQGDLTPLLDEQYHAFFGRSARLTLAGRNGQNGSLTVSQFQIAANALDLSGAAEIAAGGRLAKLSLSGKIAPPSGDAVTLPMSGLPTTIRGATLAAAFDAAEGNTWTLTTVVDGLVRTDLSVSRTELTAQGTLDQSAATRLTGTLDARVDEISVADGGLQSAIGPRLALVGGFDWTSGGALALSDFGITGEDYTARVTGQIGGLESGLELSGKAEVDARDLSRFAGISGSALAGSARATLEGKGAPLSGSFDVRLNATATDLAAGIAQLDPLITGQTVLSLDTARDEAGIMIRSFELNGTALTASANGTVRTGKADVTLRAALDDLGRIYPVLPGPVTLTGDVSQEGDTATGTIKLRAPGGNMADLEGSVTTEGAVDVAYSALLSQLETFVPQLGGAFTAKGRAQRSAAGQWQVSSETDGSAGIRGKFQAAFNDATGAADITLDAAFARIERLVPQIAGDLTARGRAQRSAEAQWQVNVVTGGTAGIGGNFDVGYSEADGTVTAKFDALFDRIERLVPQLSGSVSAEGQAQRSAESRWTASAQTGGSAGLSGALAGMFDETSGAADLNFDAALARIERLVPQIDGILSARGEAHRAADKTWRAKLETGGTAGLGGTFEGGFDESSGAADVTLDAAFERIERLVPQLSGTLSAKGAAARLPSSRWQGEVETGGDAGLSGKFNGSFTETTGAVDVFFDAALERVQRFVPNLTGTLAAKGRARRSDEGAWKVNAVSEGSAGLSGTFKAEYDEAGGDAEVYFDTALARIERLVPDFSGTFSAAGVASKSGDTWKIDTSATGPGGISAVVDGTYDQAANRADVTAKGKAQLGLANAFIEPNSLRGEANFDLALRGEPAVSSISGTVTSGGATVAIPSIAQTITDLNTTVQLAGGRANIVATGGLRAGGQFRVTGPVGLTAPFDAGLQVQLLNIILKDNISYSSSANGEIRFDGPLTGNGKISGAITFGATEINIATAGGSVSAAPIPDIRHVGEAADTRRTRAFAKLIDTGNGGSGAVYGLDLTLNAPARIFARGRGLNAELGGSVTLLGTTADVRAVGQIALIRGSFDILGRRLTLDEGGVSLQGNLEPYIRFVASTSTSEGDAMLIISGPASGPVISVTSVPERPSEEALALLLFGDKFSDLSPLKIAQLGSQLATLGGSGGGFLDRIRKALGVDSLDLGADADGNAEVGVGTYITEKVYTDVSVNSQGESEVNLNFDVTDTIKLKGSVDSKGDTGIGLFFQKDY